MVLDAFFDWLASAGDSALGSVAGMIPAAPSVFAGACGQAASAAELVRGSSSWIPFDIILPMFVAVMAVWAVGLGIKIVRIVASFGTLGGGSAG